MQKGGMDATALKMADEDYDFLVYSLYLKT